MAISSSRLVRLLAGATLVAALVSGVAPAEARAPTCGGRALHTEYGGSDLDGGSAFLDEDATLRLVDLEFDEAGAAGSCPQLQYGFVAADSHAWTVPGDGALMLSMNGGPVPTFTGSAGELCTAFSVVVLNPANGDVLDQSPDVGSWDLCVGQGGSQFFR